MIFGIGGNYIKETWDNFVENLLMRKKKTPFQMAQPPKRDIKLKTIKILKKVVEDGALSSTEVKVYIACLVLSYSQVQFSCEEVHRSIGALPSKKVVRACLLGLADAQYLRKELLSYKGRTRKNVYRLNIDYISDCV
jgi:hypothetical protein